MSYKKGDKVFSVSDNQVVEILTSNDDGQFDYQVKRLDGSLVWREDKLLREVR